MVSDLRRWQGLEPACVVIAASLSAWPYLREWLGAAGDGAMAAMPDMPDMPGMMMGAPSAGLAHQFIALKILLTVGVFVALICLARWGRLATTPLVKAMLVGGASLAVALTGFDLCTGFHAAGMDASGACHCWTTGVLALGGALLTGIAVVWSRALTAFVAGVVQTIVALATRAIRPAAGLRKAARAFARPGRYVNLVGRGSAGRAPPHPLVVRP